MHIETRGSGPDLVMLHGWAMHAGLLASFADALQSRFRLHLVDLPGHGFSRDDRGSLEPAECARRIADATPPAIWLGWSLGGLLALRAALDRPDRVRGLVEIASSPRFVVGADWPHGVEDSVFAAFADGLARDYRATIERFLALEVLGSDQARAELRDLKSHVFERGEPSRAALEEGLSLLDRVDLRAEVAHLRVPSLWIAGRRDRLIKPAAMQWAAAATAGGRYVECNSGHAPFLTHAGALAQTVEDFAKEIA